MRELGSAALLVASLVALAAAAPAGADRLASVDTLVALRAAADANEAPHARDRERLLEDARDPWQWGTVSGPFVTSGPANAKTCHAAGARETSSYLTEGAPDAYAMALAAHLAGDTWLPTLARARVLDLVDTRDFDGLDGRYGGSNQCILELAFAIPIWIETARLLEDVGRFTAGDAHAFADWLAREVYPLVAWASHARSNNWGTAGSLAAWSIARYVEGRVAELGTFEPVQRVDSPDAAAAHHAALQLARLRGELEGDARCEARGIQAHGGIPEALRRGTTGCGGAFLAANDASWRYQALHVELLVLHAELMRNEGDFTLYEAEVVPGRPAILQAILFVIGNDSPAGRSWPWPSSRQGALRVAASFYTNGALEAAASREGSFRGGRTLPYAGLTHGSLHPHDGEDPTVVRPGQPGVPTLVADD